MQNTALDRLRTWLTADNPYLAIGTAIGVAVTAGILVGALFGSLGPVRIDRAHLPATLRGNANRSGFPAHVH
jgi:Mg/Co/Ni transporter MgtE